MCKISIIVPVYNTEKYLEKCLNSLISQTLEDIEILCINDGSTDNSIKILEQYANRDSRIKIINKKNAGVSAARNTGISQAKGEYLGFVDSDDYVDLNFYEKLYNTAKEYNASIAVAGIIRFNEFHKKYHLKLNETILSNDLKTKLKLCDVPDKSYVWNKIYKTDEFKKNNLNFSEGVYYEDVIFTPKALYYLKDMVTVPDTYYYYYRRSNSIVTIRSEKTNQDSLRAKEYAANFFKEHNIDVSDIETITKRYKLAGFTIFKVKTKGKIQSYSLFNIIKWKKHK